MGSEVRLRLAEDGADAERLEALTGFPRQELLRVDVVNVTTLPGQPPRGRVHSTSLLSAGC